MHTASGGLFYRVCGTRSVFGIPEAAAPRLVRSCVCLCVMSYLVMFLWYDDLVTDCVHGGFVSDYDA